MLSEVDGVTALHDDAVKFWKLAAAASPVQNVDSGISVVQEQLRASALQTSQDLLLLLKPRGAFARARRVAQQFVYVRMKIKSCKLTDGCDLQQPDNRL